MRPCSRRPSFKASGLPTWIHPGILPASACLQYRRWPPCYYQGVSMWVVHPFFASGGATRSKGSIRPWLATERWPPPVYSNSSAVFRRTNLHRSGRLSFDGEDPTLTPLHSERPRIITLSEWCSGTVPRSPPSSARIPRRALYLRTLKLPLHHSHSCTRPPSAG